MTNSEALVTPEWVIQFWPEFASGIHGYKEGDVSLTISRNLLHRVEQEFNRRVGDVK